MDHVCVSNYKPVVGNRGTGYNKIVASFKIDRIGGFIKIVVVNPLHEKLPRFVLVVCCTYYCLDAACI
jgi:hypothetical protein